MSWQDVAVTAIEVAGMCFILWLITRNNDDE